MLESILFGAVLSCANPLLPAAIAGGATRHGALPVIRVRLQHTTVQLAVAKDVRTRETGLMCVTSLRPHTGMIFVFPSDTGEQFWMKNTLIPLDMVFVRADGTVSSVADRVPASTIVTADDAVARRNGVGKFVIELAAGEAARDGIAAGTHLVLPPLAASD